MTDIIAAKDEYLDDRLKKASEIVWLWVCGATDRANDDLVPDGWFDQTIRRLKSALDGNTTDDDLSVPFFVYWRALQILNVPRTLASSSAARERTERFGNDQ